MLRGNAGDPIFFDDRDRYRLYLIIQHAVEKFHCRIHAFCLMRNHLHLVVQVEDIPISSIMQNISLRYTKWINHTRKRTSHLFQGRYKAILVDADAYLVELVRYIHLNPVRANVSPTPEYYPWSGHRCYLGSEQIPWLTIEPVLSQLAPGIEQTRMTYASFVFDGINEGRRDDFHSGTCERRILGDEQFTDTIFNRTDQKSYWNYSLADVICSVCAHYRIFPEQLQTSANNRPMIQVRGIAAALV
jgi:putative transposase